MMRPLDAGSAGETSRRLESALQDRLGQGPVDVARLLARVDQGSRRARARRRAGAAVACAAVVGAGAVVVPGLARPAGTGSPRATIGTGGALTAAPDPSRSLRASSSSSSSSSSDDPATARRVAYAEDVAYAVPDDVGLRQRDFPEPLTDALFDSGQYRLQPSVSGQSCQDPSITGPDPAAGRQWSWSRPNSNFTVDLVVTGWKSGTGSARFRDVLENTGPCRWVHAQQGVPVGDLAGDQAWSGANTFAGLRFAHTLVRVGDVLVGVEVMAPVAESNPMQLAQRLARTTATRVRATGLGS